MRSFKGDNSMGKKSLIKSTAKKKSGTKEEEEKTTKKAAAKSTKKPATKSSKKAAPKSTKQSAAKTTKKSKPATAKKPPKSAPAQKTDTQKTAPAKPKAAPKKTAKPKKVSVHELLLKKFETTQGAPAPMASPKSATPKVSAPPLIDSHDPKEVARLHSVLLKKFSMEEVRAAAKEPAHAPKAVKAPPAAKVPETAQAAPAKPSPAKVSAAKSVEEDAYITVESNAPKPAEAEPMSSAVKIAVAVAATIIFLVLAISYNNSSKYYVQPKDDAIEIWKGRFSPKDTRFFMVLHGVQVPEPVKEVYTQEEIFPLIFNYYVDKADTLLEVPGLPDFDGIKNYLHQAEDFIVTNDMRASVTSRLNNIERMTLLYKADVAMSKDTEDSLESAIKQLKSAATLTPSPAQAEEIAQMIETARERMANLKAVTK